MINIDVNSQLSYYLVNQEWQNLNVFLENAYASQTWGIRTLKVVGYKGSVTLNLLTSTISTMAHRRFILDNLSIEERVAGIEILKKLTHFYHLSDQKIKKSNFLIRIISIKENNVGSARSNLELGITENYFRAFSEENFIDSFKDIDLAVGRMTNPKRFIATEELIRKKCLLEVVEFEVELI